MPCAGRDRNTGGTSLSRPSAKKSFTAGEGADGQSLHVADGPTHFNGFVHEPIRFGVIFLRECQRCHIQQGVSQPDAVAQLHPQPVNFLVKRPGFFKIACLGQHGAPVAQHPGQVHVVIGIPTGLLHIVQQFQGAFKVSLPAIKSRHFKLQQLEAFYIVERLKDLQGMQVVR